MMTGTARLRRPLLALALLLTLAAVIWASRETPNVETTAPVAARRAPPASTKRPPPANADSTAAKNPALAEPRPRAASEGEITNLFAKHSWYVAPPPQPPTAPPLPFAYLGKVIDGNRVEVFVSSADSNFTVKKGDVIDGTYRVEEIAPPIMTVIYLPLSQKQTLEIGRAN